MPPLEAIALEVAALEAAIREAAGRAGSRPFDGMKSKTLPDVSDAACAGIVGGFDAACMFSAG
jgi:hypothetical protein